LDQERRRRQALHARVVPDAVRCVQCGICSYNCPMGIDIRGYAWRSEPVSDSRCIACGECVARCPRGVLYFEAACNEITT
jgi:ferredoxin